MKRDSKNPYPNLRELIKYHPYHIGTFASFANVELDLLEAALIGEEELTAAELWRIANYAGVPYGVLACPSIILLDAQRPKHRRLLEGIIGSLGPIFAALDAGSPAAEDFILTFPRLYYNQVIDIWGDFSAGKPVSYCRYLGVRAKLDMCQTNIALERPKKRKRRRAESAAPQE